jgi:tetratricopeptide (TPR) repeat protein
MVRDTAYDAILKRTRADLHERFVAWADVANQDRGVEFEEILGYHLEQACKYLSELGPLDDHGRAIGGDGSRRLASAGRRAFARGDIPGAVTLLGRAAALLSSDHPERLRLLPEHGEALLMTGRFGEASIVLEEAIGHASVAPAVAARARLVRLLVGLRTGDSEEWGPNMLDRESEDAIRVFEASGDEAGLAMAWRLLAWSAGIACRYGDAADAAERAAHHARRAGDVRQERRAVTAYAAAASLGPTLVDDAIARCETALEQTAGDRQSEGQLIAVLAGLYAMQGMFDRARELVSHGRTLFSDLGMEMHAARLDVEAWRVEMLAGDLSAAENALRAADGVLAAAGEKYLLSWVAGLLAQTLIYRGDLDEADRLGRESEALAPAADVASQALWRCVRGRVMARQGAAAGAEAILREALSLLEPTDATVLQIETYLDLGEVLTTGGDLEGARRAYESARALAERKGGVVVLSTVLHRLQQLDAARVKI